MPAVDANKPIAFRQQQVKSPEQQQSYSPTRAAGHTPFLKQTWKLRPRFTTSHLVEEFKRIPLVKEVGWNTNTRINGVRGVARHLYVYLRYTLGCVLLGAHQTGIVLVSESDSPTRCTGLTTSFVGFPLYLEWASGLGRWTAAPSARPLLIVLCPLLLSSCLHRIIVFTSNMKRWL